MLGPYNHQLNPGEVVEDSREFEDEVRFVYKLLLNLKGDGVLVSQNARIKGRSQSFHHFDIYYEFERAGVRHKVAIECADPKHPVDRGLVGELGFKLADVGNITGLVVSRGGYMPGVDNLARQYGIELLSPADLPSIDQLFAKRRAAVALPDETGTGEPFWTIMELRDGVATGSYYASEHPETHQRNIPLLYARSHAERIMREGQLDPRQWGVRGLPKASLRAFIVMLELLETRGGGAVILFLPPAAREGADFIAMPVTRQQLIDQYYGAPLVPAKPPTT
jgi:hypothetical protein